jgi:hypothetical protein
MSDLPESLTIPAQLIERWLSKPESARPQADLTRLDWDYLYTAFDKGLISQARLRDALVSASKGDLAEAEGFIAETSRLLTESQNAWRRFFTAVMASSFGDEA